MTSIESDSRISSAHISYSLWKKWADNGHEQPIYIFRQDLVDLFKISSYNTYHKVIRQLHEYGYIRYLPSYNHFLGSLVYFEGQGQNVFD